MNFNFGRSQGKDLITPHKLTILALVKEVCSAKNKLRNHENESSVPWFENSKQKTDFAIVLLELMQGPDMKLNAFLKIVKKVLSATLYAAFAARLKEISAGGISGLMDFIQSLETVLVDPAFPVPIVHKSSVIGLFIRHMMLAFDKLSFGQMTKQYHRYQDYCLDEFREEDSICEEMDDQKDVRDEESAVPISRRQAELFVARHVALLQTNEKAALSPPELQKKLQLLLTANPNLAEAHFLSLMNCLRVCEYYGVMHSLHRTFDCTPIDCKAEETPRNFRFAALNLGSLLCRFGFWEEAYLALREAMTMARESNDNVCLQHTLGWLYRLEKDRPDILVDRSIAKTGELQLPYLTSLGILTFSQMKAKTPAKPSEVFEFLRKCDILNCQHSILELTTQSYAEKTSLWSLYGKKIMVLLSAQILLYLNTSEPSCRGLYHIGEPLCRALCHVASVLSREGQFECAREMISLAKDQFPKNLTFCSLWMFQEQVLNFEWAVWRGDWNKAAEAVENIRVFDPAESRLRKAEMLLSKGETAVACHLLNDIPSNLKSKDSDYKIRNLLLLGQCHCLTNNPCIAILPLIKALDLAQHFHLAYLEALVSLHLANVQYLMDCTSLALTLLDKIKVSILSHGYVLDRAKHQLLHAKCVYRKSVECRLESERRSMVCAAAFELGSASEDFLKVEAFYFAKDALYRQACLFDHLGDKENRNRAAHQFRQLEQLVPSSTLLCCVEVF